MYMPCLWYAVLTAVIGDAGSMLWPILLLYSHDLYPFDPLYRCDSRPRKLVLMWSLCTESQLMNRL